MPVESNEPLGSDLAATIFCPACQTAFAATTFPTRCPGCGGSVDGLQLAAAQTVEIRDKAERRRGHLPAARDDEVDILIGRDLHIYRCVELLGAGGMGRVYLAQHHHLERHCALKILSPHLAKADPDFIVRFMNEGRSAAALIHPNVVTTHAIGESQGYHYLEMEFVAGRSLRMLVDEEGALPPVRATALAARIAEGLAAAHRKSILHRDLKLDNVLLSHQQVPKVADFGLAKRLAAGTVQELVGTPQYMAPELFQGASTSPASDVYALGICYFLLLTGRFPFTAGSLNSLIQRVVCEPLPNVRQLVPSIPLEMAECVSMLTAKAPQNRPADAMAAAQLLHAILGHARDVASLLEEAFRDVKGVRWKREGAHRYRIDLNLPTGRRQIVYLEPSEHAAAEQLLMITSTCCHARSVFYEAALKLNAEMLHGGLAVRGRGDEKYFVVIDTFPRATVDAEEIRRSVMEVAARADSVEKLLTGRDVH